MNYIIYLDKSELQVAKIIKSNKNQLQVEDLLQKIPKTITSSNCIYELNNDRSINPNDLLSINKNHIHNTDIDILFESLDYNVNYKINELAQLYFGNKYNEIDVLKLLYSLFNEKIKFDFKNKTFKKSTKEEQELKIRILNKKNYEESQIENFVTSLINFKNPNFATNIYKILYKPNKQNLEYKALIKACKILNVSELDLCLKIGLVKSLDEYFLQCFLIANFSNGFKYHTQSSNYKNNFLVDANYESKIFSIDDSETTEIDDAFSVVELENNLYKIGVHIAAPALDNELFEDAVSNISTIYFPFNKITMFDKNIVDKYSLRENELRIVLSLYFVIDKKNNICESFTKLEKVKIYKNIHISNLEANFNLETIGITQNYEFEKELKILYNFASTLEAKRGKKTSNHLICDYSFEKHNEKISLKPRFRGTPIDLVVSEMMILTNCTWGRLLTNSFVGAIYRVKEANKPVKITIDPNSHKGLNVDYYTWATSPLRRAVDFINQYQIISLITKYEKPLPKDNNYLVTVVNTFETKYTKYLEFQKKMEKYWSLKYILQENIENIEGVFVYKNRVQLLGIPILIELPHNEAKEQGSKIALNLSNIDLINLTFNFHIIKNLTNLK